MRYLAAMFLLLLSLSFLGCGKSPEGEVNYNELKDTPPPAKEAPSDEVIKAPN
jgi:hypothetical protein